MSLSVEWPLVRASIRSRPEAVDEGTDAPSREGNELNELKERVADVRSRVGQKLWASLTTPPLRKKGNTTVASRAYYKMSEIMQTCALARAGGPTVHLCEAPGGFVQALAHDEPASDWTWKAMSISSGPRPAWELLPRERGTFLEGDVFDWAWCETSFDKGVAKMVTADGATDMDHGKLEEAHFPLLMAQTRLAFHCLREGGDFVVKFFEGMDRKTQDWIAYMTTRFQETSIVKPFSSRPTNSERYLICRGFSPSSDSSPSVANLVVAAEWRQDLQRIVNRLAADQIRQLQRVFSIVDQTC